MAAAIVGIARRKRELKTAACEIVDWQAQDESAARSIELKIFARLARVCVCRPPQQRIIERVDETRRLIVRIERAQLRDVAR